MPTINDITILVVQHNVFDAPIQTFVGRAYSGGISASN